MTRSGDKVGFDADGIDLMDFSRRTAIHFAGKFLWQTRTG
jgi:hypothetical protein